MSVHSGGVGGRGRIGIIFGGSFSQRQNQKCSSRLPGSHHELKSKGNSVVWDSIEPEWSAQISH